MEKERGNVIYIFTYILTWITGLIIFLTEGQKNNRIKFHSLQAIFLGITAIVLDLILFFVPFLGPFLVFLIWVYGMYIAVKAYNGEDVKAPVIGDYAAKYSGYTP
jgi:Predicted membrane protein